MYTRMKKSVSRILSIFLTFNLFPVPYVFSLISFFLSSARNKGKRSSLSLSLSPFNYHFVNNRLKRSTLRTGLGSTSSPPMVPTIHPPRPVRFRWKSRAMSTHGSSFMREAFDRRARNSVNRARNIEPFIPIRECVSMSEPRWIRATSGRDDRQSLPRRWYNHTPRPPLNCGPFESWKARWNIRRGKLESNEED